MTQTQSPGGAPNQPGQPNQYGAPYGAPNQYGPPNQYGAPQQPQQPQQYGAPNQTPYGAAPYGSIPQQAGPPPAGLGGQGYPPPQGPRSTNGLAVAALILAILLAPIGLILGIIALVQIRKRDQGGTGLAVAGVVIGGLGTLGILAAVVLLAFATPTLNTDPIEAQISTATAQAVGTAPSSVSCPDSVDVQPGGVFTCTAVLEGTQLPFQVTQKDDQGNVDFQSKGWVATAKAKQALDDAAARNIPGIPVTTTCADGKSVVVGGPGTTFECQLAETANPSNLERHTVTITNDNGDITID